MPLLPTTFTTLTVGGTASAQVGNGILSYSIKTDGANAATLTVQKVVNGATSGTTIWTEVLPGASLGTVRIFNPSLGPTTDVSLNWLYVTLTGTGAVAYIQSQ